MNWWATVYYKPLMMWNIYSYWGGQCIGLLLWQDIINLKKYQGKKKSKGVEMNQINQQTAVTVKNIMLPTKIK